MGVHVTKPLDYLVSTNYYVIKRNFDPDTWSHSSYINGQLWTYSRVADVSDTESFVFTQPVDPLAFLGYLNAPVASGVVGNDLLLFGGFWTGLTRDDVGGLRYIYRHNNYNIETATNSFGAGAGAAVSTGNGSPWTVPIFGTNTAGGVVIPGGTTNFVDSALRAGIGQIRFVRVPLESVFGPKHFEHRQFHRQLHHEWRRTSADADTSSGGSGHPL